MILNNKWFNYLVLICLFILIGMGVTYFAQDNGNQTAETVQGSKDDILSKLKPAPEGYAWYVTKEGGFAFLYENSDRINICDDTALCTLLKIPHGGLIINNTNVISLDNTSDNILPGGKNGTGSVARFGEIGRQDLYRTSIGVAYMDNESRIDPNQLNPEQTVLEIRKRYDEEFKIAPIVFTEKNRGTYNPDHTKPLPPVFIITNSGVFRIGPLTNDPMQRADGELCITESQEDCIRPGTSREDYAGLPEYINTIVQSFTVI